MPQATADGARHSAFLGKTARPGSPRGAAQQTLQGGWVPPHPRAPSELGKPRPCSQGPGGRPDSQGPVHGPRRTRAEAGVASQAASSALLVSKEMNVGAGAARKASELHPWGCFGAFPTVFKTFWGVSW